MMMVKISCSTIIELYMQQMCLDFFLQCAVNMVHVAGNVSVIAVRVTLGFTDNKRSNLFFWATLMFVDRLLAYGTPCVSVEVAEVMTRFIVLQK
jgi:hypothetical protein